MTAELICHDICKIGNWLEYYDKNFQKIWIMSFIDSLWNWSLNHMVYWLLHEDKTSWVSFPYQGPLTQNIHHMQATFFYDKSQGPVSI